MKNITPCLWFENNDAEEAVNFYLSIFKNSKITNVMHNPPKVEHGKPGEVLLLEFQLNGRDFLALNGGNYATFNPAISMAVPCDSQEEIDEVWDKLLEGGEPMQCGWLTDKYGVAWQVYGAVMPDLMNSRKNPKKAQAVYDAMCQMIKIDLVKLQKVYDEA